MSCPRNKKRFSNCDSCTCGTTCKGSRRIRRQPRNKTLRRKLQSTFQPELCCPKSCAIFGALDRPYHGKLEAQYFNRPKRSKVDVNSLGTPVGVVYSRACMRPSLESDEQSKRLTTYLKAFALIFLLPENKWTEHNIDQLVREGSNDRMSNDRLVSFDAPILKVSSSQSSAENVRLAGGNDTENASVDSLSNLGTNSSVSGRSSFRDETLCETELITKTHSFILEDHKFTIQLLPKYNPGGKLRPILLNLKVYMRRFFKKLRYCLFWTEEFGYLLIWRRRSAFFVLDLNGRKKRSFKYLDHTSPGLAMLLCLKSLDNVIYLITELSSTSKTDMFQLRGLIVTRLETPDGRLFTRETHFREMEFTVISDEYAFLKSQVHLTLNRHDHLRNRSSIMVGVTAMIAAKIDHAASWNTYILDRIICLGLRMCRNCWQSCNTRPINLDTFPTQLRLGQYVAELSLLASVKFGNWRCSKPFRDNDYERHLIGALEEHKSVLFQINNQMYAIWLSHKYYYLLDPYKHTIDTNSKEPSEKKEKLATLRMFRSKVTFLRVFHTMLIESNRSSTFYIHALKIKNLQQVPYGYALKPRPEEEEHMDVQSLNETICFTGDYQECIDELSQDSGYELDVFSYTDVPLYADIVFEVPKFEDMSEEMEEGESDLDGIEFDDDIDLSPQQNNKLKRDDAKTKSNQRKSKSKTTVKRDSAKFLPTKIKEIPMPMPIEEKKEVKQEKVETKKVERKKDARIVDSQELEFFKNRKKVNSFTEQTKRRKVCITPPISDCEEEEQADCNDGRLADYPGYSKEPHNIAVCGSESGTIESIRRLMRSAFKCAARVLMLTPWGNYVVFRECQNGCKIYYVFEGCICNVDHFRHMDLRFGTAGLKPFQSRSQVVCYIIDRREANALSTLRERLADSRQHLESLKARGP